MPFEFEFTDNSREVIEAMMKGKDKALEALGAQVENYAKLELENDPRRVDTGRLRNSITHVVNSSDDSVTVGSNVNYAVYVHEGTGIFGPNGGTGGWWVYVPGGDRSSGQPSGKRYTKAEAARIVAYLREKGVEAYMTQGMKPNRFLKNAVEKHQGEFADIVKQNLEQ